MSPHPAESKSPGSEFFGFVQLEDLFACEPASFYFFICTVGRPDRTGCMAENTDRTLIAYTHTAGGRREYLGDFCKTESGFFRKLAGKAGYGFFTLFQQTSGQSIDGFPLLQTEVGVEKYEENNIQAK